MSDRYYSQMAKSFSMTEGELKQKMRTDEGRAQLEAKLDKLALNSYSATSTKKRVTKKDISKQIAIDLGVDLDVTKANMEALECIVNAIKTKKICAMYCPEGRLKRPYIETLVEMIGVKEDGIEQLTVANMKQLIEGLMKIRAGE